MDNQEVLGSLSEVFVPETMDIFCEELIAMAEGRGYFQGETVNQTLRGERRNVILTMTIPSDPDRLDRVLVSTMDITERKRAQEALQENEERMRMMVENVPAMIDAIDAEGNCILWNRECERVTGYSADEIIGNPHAMELLYPDRERFERVMEEMGDHTADFRDVEWDIRRKDGETRTISWANISNQVSIPGLAQWAVGVDVTERREAERALRESERGYRELLDSISDGIAVMDSDFRLARINHALRQDIGKEEGLIGQTCYSAFYGFETHCPWCPAKKVFATGQVQSETVPFPADSPRRWFHLRVSPICDGDGQVTHIIESGRDITGRMELEEQLHRQERLAALGQMAGGIAHDFNNILASIILYAQMPLTAPNVQPRIRNACETILVESRRAADLVQQILNFSRSAMMDTEPLSLVDLVREAATLLRRTIPANVHLSTKVTSDPCVIEADGTRIHQALTNLALNAKDAMPEGGELSFVVEPFWVSPADEPPLADMSAGAWARLSVSDTGSGMSDEVQEHLFEPFFTTKDVDKGTGLGLAQVYGIVKQHEGFIDVETAVGQGTTFTIYLPLAEEEGEREPAQGA